MGTVVDEKVVEMRFDNSRFESNVRQSMNTLDKLKQKLDFSKSTKNFEELERTANRINFRPLEKSIDSVTASFSGLQIAGATVISELTKSGMRFAKKFLGISRTITNQIKVGGKQRALNIEQAKFQLKGLGIEWSKIEDDINYGVKDTAYGLDAAAKAASQLSASNVKIGDEMKAALRGISGVAAMTNASFEEISPIFTTVAGQGKLMTMQLRQLESRGLNAAATLGKALGKTEAEIREMVTKGQIDFNTFSKAMNDAFGEHAKEANKTFTGALSNVKAALSRIGADFYTSGLENVRKVLVKLIPTINGIHKGIKPLIEDVNKFVGRKSKSIIRFLKNFNNEIDATNRRVNKTQWDKLKEAGVVTDEFREILKKTAKENGVNIDKMIKKDGNLRATLKRDWLSYDILTKALKKYKKVDREAAKSEAFKNLKSEMKQTTNLEHLLKILTNIKITIKQVADAAKVAWEDIFPKDKDSNKIKTALQSFSEFSEKIKLSKDEFEKVRRTLSGVFAIIDVIAYTIQNVLNTGLDVLTYAVSDTDASLLDLTANIGDALVKFRDWYKNSNTVKKVLEVVGGVCKKLIDIIKKVYSVVEKIVTNASVQKFFSLLHDILSSIVTIIRNIFTSIGEGASKVSPKVATIVDKIKSFFKEIKADPSSILDKVFGILNKGLSLVSNLLDKIKKKDPKEIIENFSKWVQNTLNKIRSEIEKFTKNPYKYVSDMLENIKDRIIEFKNEISNINLFGDLFKFKNNDPKFNLFSKISETVKNVFNNLYEYLKNIVAKIFDIFSADSNGRNSFVLIIFLFEFIKIIEQFTTLIDRVLKPLASLDAVFGALKQTLKDYQNSLKADRIVSIAKAVFILASAMLLVSTIPPDRLKSSAIAVGGMLAAMVALSLILKKFSLDDTSKVSLTLQGLCLSLLEVVLALKMMETVDLSKIQWQTFATILALFTAFIGISAMLAKAEVNSINKAVSNAILMSAAMLSMAMSLRILVGAIDKITKLDIGSTEEEYKQNIIKILVAFTTLVGMFAFISASSTWNVTIGSAATLLSMAVTLEIMLLVFKQILRMDPKSVEDQQEKLKTVILSLIGLMAALRIGGKNAASAGLGAISMVIAIKMLSKVVEYIKDMKENLIIGIGVVGILTVFLSMLISATRLSNIDKKTPATLIALMTSVALMGAIVTALGSLDEVLIVKGIMAVGAISLAISSILKSTGKMAEKPMKVYANLLGVIAVVGALSLLVKNIAKLNGEELAVGIIGLYAVLGALELLIVISKHADKLSTETKNLANIAIIVATFAMVTVALGQLEPSQLATGIIGLGLMLGALEMLIVISKHAKYLGTTVNKYITPLVGIVVALSSVAFILSMLKPSQLATGIIGLGAMIGALELLVIISKTIKGMSADITTSIPILLIMVGVVALLSGIALLLGKFGGDSAIKGAISIFTMIIGLSFSIHALATLGISAKAALSTLPSVLLVLGIFAIIAGVLGAFVADSALGENILKGIDFIKTMLTKLGESIGSAIGGILVGFSEQFVVFTGNMATAFDSLANVDDAKIETARNMIGLIGDFAGSAFSGGIKKLKKNVKKLPELKDNLLAFADVIIAYQNKVSGVTDWSATEASTTGFGKLLNALDKLPKKGGSWQDVFGTPEDVATFGNKLATLGLCMVAYNNSVSSVTDWKPVENSITAIEGLVDIAKQVPNFGGKLQDFFGEKNMDTFGDQLEKFGVGLVNYYNTVKDITDWDPVKNSATAAESLTAVAQEIPKTGGFIQSVLGVKDLGDFGNKLQQYGEAFAQYANAIANVSMGKVDMSINLTERFTELAQTVKSNKLYKDKKLWQFLIYINDDILPEFQRMHDYVGLNFLQSSSILRGVMTTMTEFANFLASDDIKNLKDASEVFSVLTYSLDRLNSLDPEAATKLNSILETLASDSLKSFNDVFTNSDGDVKTALESFKTNVKNGLNEILGDENTEGTLLNSFKKSGEYLVDGLIKGVKSKQQKFNKTLKSLGTKGHNAYKKSVGEHSPAKEFIESGKNIVLGLVTGITSLFDKPGQILENLATTMTEEFNENLKLDFDMEDLTKNISGNLSTAKLADMTIIPNLVVSGTNSEKVKALGLRLQKELTETTAKSYIEGVSEVAVKSVPEVLKKTGAKLSKSAIKDAQTLVKESNSFVIGLYTKTDAYKEDAKNLKDHQKNLTKLLKEFKKQTVVSKHDEQINSKISSHEKSIEKLQEKIEEATDSEVKKSLNKQVRKHKKQIEQLNKKLKSKNSTKDLQSIRDNIKNAVQEIQNDRKAILEHAIQTIETLRTSLMDSIKDFSNPFKIALDDTEHKIDDIFTKFEKSTSTSFKKLLKNLNSQIKGQSLFDEYITKLTGLGYDSEVIDKIKEMGAAEGTAIAKALSKATSEEVKAYNTAYSKTKGKTTKDKWLDEIQKKKNKLKEYDSLMLKASGMGFNKQVFEEIVNMDVDTAIEYLKIMTSMSNTERDYLNKTMKKSNDIAKKYANRVIGYYATAGSEAMKKLAGEMNGKKAQEIGENICNGLVEGILNNKGKVNKTGKKLGKDLLDEIRKVLGIHSPSTKFANVGFNSVRGLVNGITQNAYLVKGAIKSVGNNAVAMLNSTLSAISNSTNGDLQPTIKPLFDMSNVERGFNAMGNMFNSPYAIGLTAGVADSFAGGGINASNGNITNNKNVTFNQYNYSPEPLSRIDIYKQTQRQLRNAEGKI